MLIHRSAAGGEFIHPLRTALLAILAFGVAGCGVIPGDAAAKFGQPEQAAKYYQREANKGNAEAALRLGNLVDERKVSSTIYGSAVDWFKKASELGSLEGCHNVGVAYEYGTHGLEKDYVQAQAYYLKAATAGYMPSQYNLGSLYANNHVSPPNDVEGLKWMLLAQMSAAQDKTQPLAQKVLDDLPGHKTRLEMRLSDAQLQEARALAEEWKATGSKAK